LSISRFRAAATVRPGIGPCPGCLALASGKSGAAARSCRAQRCPGAVPGSPARRPGPAARDDVPEKFREVRRGGQVPRP
jgi:hypothetical protein